MKFETQLSTLLEAVSTTARFAERKANLPVLGCVLLIAEGNRIILRATNLECGVEAVIPVKVSVDGVAAIPASVFIGFLSNARGKTVSISLTKEVLTVKTEHAQASIKTVSHDDFPVLPRVSAEHSFKIKSGDFVRAIRSVSYCASLSAVKPELQSVLIYGEAGKLVAAATDSFRLAEKIVPLRAGGSVPELLIPARNAAELVRILDTIHMEIELYYNDNQLSLQTDGIYYTSRLLDGSFPKYRQIIPKSFTTEAVVLREDMATALKSLSIFADKFAQVSLSLDSAKKSLFLSSRNPDIGEQISTIQAAVQGESFSISFNGRYLADSLQSISGDSVRLHSNGAGKAMLIKDASDESFLYLVMPMNR